MKSIQKVVEAKVSEMVEGGAVERMIGESVEKAITSSVKSLFESYGGITREITKVLEEGLRVNVKDIPFESYNAQMLVAIKQRLGNMFQGVAYEHFLEQIEGLLKPVPKELSINDLLEFVASTWKDEWCLDDDDREDYLDVDIKRHDDARHSYSIRLKKRATDGEFDGVHIYLWNGKIRINHNQRFNPTCFSPVDAYIFKLYAAGTLITGMAEFNPDMLNLELRRIVIIREGDGMCRVEGDDAINLLAKAVLSAHSVVVVDSVVFLEGGELDRGIGCDEKGMADSCCPGCGGRYEWTLNGEFACCSRCGRRCKRKHDGQVCSYCGVVKGRDSVTPGHPGRACPECGVRLTIVEFGRAKRMRAGSFEGVICGDE